LLNLPCSGRCANALRHATKFYKTSRESNRTNINRRIADYPIDPTFLERWSPRALMGEPIAEAKFSELLMVAGVAFIDFALSMI
jgi:hypothetical protein